MLNRRILRIKAFKAIYSYAENPTMTVGELEAQLDRSCESTRDLYLFLLSVTEALATEAKDRIEAARAKFNPTDEERNPNLKFVNNRISAQLSADPDFTKILSRKHLSWAQYDVLVRHLYESVRSKDWFKAYLAQPEQTIKEDSELWIKIFEEEFDGNKELESILEDLSIWWNDDLAYSLSWCCRTMEELGNGGRWSLPPLYMSDLSASSRESDKAFVVNTVRAAQRNFESYVARISELTPKWDRNRICTTDLALIISGLAESDANPSIPKKVTINEFVEISKFYSTPESRSFVNGLLDKLIEKQTISL